MPDRDAAKPLELALRQIAYEDERPCKTCGEPHLARHYYEHPLPEIQAKSHNPNMRTWAGDDGHAYARKSPEEIARHALAAYAGALAVDEHADALRKLAEDD